MFYMNHFKYANRVVTYSGESLPRSNLQRGRTPYCSRKQEQRLDESESRHVEVANSVKFELGRITIKRENNNTTGRAEANKKDSDAPINI